MGDTRELELLEALVDEPEVRQIDLAARLDVAVGTVNWLLKRLAGKGLIKIRRIGRWQWRYVLTPRGMSEKARLAQQYVQYSMQFYRRTREAVLQQLDQIKRSGYSAVQLEWDVPNDLIDICRLTCLERGVKIQTEDRSVSDGQLPSLYIHGREILVKWPSSGNED
jgi:DNA-binding MarR family transcriptional regulator